ncbi:MAG: hypothetical protein AAF458_14695 [Pseudomonadota bacterium]
MRIVLGMMCLFAAWLAPAATEGASVKSEYAADTTNDIKALTPDEVQGLTQGQGMGFAKAAELNQHPGPLHVLELADRLHLTDSQRVETERVFARMRARAVELGTLLVEHERALDQLFSQARVSATSLDSALQKIGATRARLRGVHLHAHIEMKQILSRHQVMRYDELRGYGTRRGTHQHRHRH